MKQINLNCCAVLCETNKQMKLSKCKLKFKKWFPVQLPETSVTENGFQPSTLWKMKTRNPKKGFEII